MAPPFLISRLAPCSGTPVHTLSCTHTICAPLLHPKSSSRCAPNCKAVSLLTSAEPSFLCPVCYNTYLHSQYDEFVHRSETRSRQGERPVEVIVKQVKGGKGDFDKWYDVWLGETTFEKVEKANYRWAVEVEVLRACKAVKEEKENSES